MELAVVLVILSLLAGGVMTARSLVDAARLRAVISEWDRIYKAAESFKEKYAYYPGDFPNATNHWVRNGEHYGITGCPYEVGYGLETCDGNGDGLVYGGGPDDSEGNHFWKHLVNAGMLEGDYSGTLPQPPATIIPGYHVPASAYEGAIHTIRFAARAFFMPPEYSGDRPFFITTLSAYDDGVPCAAGSCDPIFTPDDASSIDGKIDDGKPLLGHVVANPGDIGSITPMSSNLLSPTNCMTPWGKNVLYDEVNWTYGTQDYGTAQNGSDLSQCILTYRPYRGVQDQ